MSSGPEVALGVLIGVSVLVWAGSSVLLGFENVDWSENPAMRERVALAWWISCIGMAGGIGLAIGRRTSH